MHIIKLECISKEREIGIALNGEMDIYELFSNFKDFAVAIGYHPDSIKDAISQLYEEHILDD